MKRWASFLNALLAAALTILVSLTAAWADTAKLDDLFTRLATADEGEAGRIEQEIWIEWSKSGSAAMDLLLQRGRDAMEAGDLVTAVDHFTALIDHAPDFAEGYNARATAYFQEGQFGPSVADIAKTLSLNPRHFGAMAGFGMILEQTNQPDRALEVYNAALAIHPHLAGVLEAVERIKTGAHGRDL
jgi:tetratricopeptide (TPR) repeat protein